MEIYWLGHSCFRLRGRDATVLMDPCPPSTGYKIGRIPADIVTISSELPESSYRQAVQGEPKFLARPGDYEIASVLVSGVRTSHGEDADHNISFVIDLDDVRICHLGNLSHVPHADDVEALSAADVLIIPVGGQGLGLDAARAAETVSLLEPKIVLPMLYKTDAAKAELDSVDKFLREMGVEAKAPEQRLTISRRDVPADTTIVLLNYRG